jgi:hypothetical protein
LPAPPKAVNVKGMTLRGVTYQGPALENPDKLANLPSDLIEILWQVNGFIAYAGGLHVRGLVDDPSWHSLHRYWSGEMALHEIYRGIQRYDIPFGQDFLGNQFVLRDRQVFRLRADTGEVVPLSLDLPHFLDACREDPIEFLGLHLLAEFHREQGKLEPGNLVHTMPPLCLRQDGVSISMRPVPADNAISFLANFARQIQDLPEGTEVNLHLFKPEDQP